MAGNENRSLRIAAVLVLRRLQDERVQEFLNDEDEFIVTEAARAINDDWSIEAALPALANMLTSEKFVSEPLQRRAINAALRVGGDQELENLIAFAKRQDVPNVLRGEALAALGTWAEPSVLDRVDGRYRGEVKRDLEGVKTKVEKEIPAFIEDRDPEILIGISKTLANLGIDSQNDRLYQIMKRHNSPEVRATVLKALGDLQFNDIAGAMQLGMKDKEASVRTTALGLIPQLEISKEQLPNVVNPIFRSGSVREQQRMLGVLGELPIEKSGDVLAGLIADAKNNKLKESVILDLVEAVEATDSEPLIAQLEEIKGDGNSVEAYKETLVGGNRRNGYRVFNNNPTAQCTVVMPWAVPVVR